ncbi:MAG: DUF484 family protein, partial [Alphaproteobacteria bacterium]|nr:DUF484 family protein [Alphaproteobacteria bacterium]
MQAASMLSAEQVLEYLERHPDFLMRHPGLLTMLTPPARPLGDTVVDFQQFQVKSLQENTRALQAEHEGLVEFCRHQHSVQAVVHDAVLQLVQARNLNQLLEAITVDLLALFDVDVVRLGLESSVANQYENDFYAEHNYSGIVFLEEGVVNAALPPPHRAALVADIRAEVPAGFADAFEQIFT